MIHAGLGSCYAQHRLKFHIPTSDRGLGTAFSACSNYKSQRWNEQKHWIVSLLKDPHGGTFIQEEGGLVEELWSKIDAWSLARPFVSCGT